MEVVEQIEVDSSETDWTCQTPLGTMTEAKHVFNLGLTLRAEVAWFH